MLHNPLPPPPRTCFTKGPPALHASQRDPVHLRCAEEERAAAQEKSEGLSAACGEDEAALRQKKAHLEALHADKRKADHMVGLCVCVCVEGRRCVGWGQRGKGLDGPHGGQAREGGGVEGEG